MAHAATPGAPGTLTADGYSGIDLTWTAPSDDGGKPILGYRPADFLDLSVEASRREAANDDGPGHGIALRARMRW